MKYSHSSEDTWSESASTDRPVTRLGARAEREFTYQPIQGQAAVSPHSRDDRTSTRREYSLALVERGSATGCLDDL